MDTSFGQLVARMVLLAQVPGLVAAGALVLLQYESDKATVSERLLPQVLALAQSSDGLDGASSASRLLPRLSLPPAWSAGRVDEQGAIVAYAGGTQRLPRIDAALQERFATGGLGVLEARSAAGAPVITAYARPEGDAWTTVLSVSVRDLYAPLRRRAAYELAGLLVFMGLATWPLLRVATRLASPADGLSTDTGDLEPPSSRGGNQLHEALFWESELRQAAIARELHDAVGSSLAGVSLLLATTRSFASEPEAAALIARAQEQVTKITQQVRQISRGMLPAGQDRGALLAALEHFAADMAGIPGVACSVRSRGDFEQVPAELGNHLYRVVQEATNNALRHGHASRVRILLARSGTRLRLAVTDDGRGFDLDAPAPPGIGIRSMRARVHAVGGDLSIRSSPGKGTRVQVDWPARRDRPHRRTALPSRVRGSALRPGVH